MIRNLFALVFLLIIGLSSSRGYNIHQEYTALLDTTKRDTLKIDTVSISRILTAEDKLDKKKREHREIYMWGDNKKPISINPLGGILININKIYSHFSRIGKQSRRLQKVFEQEYEQDKVEKLWMPLTVKLTDLKGDSLFYFQMYFLPTSSFLENASYYEKVEYVTKSMRIYRDSTEVIHQRMRLPKILDQKR